MFGDSDGDKTQTMQRMLTEALALCRANRIEAKEKLAEWAKRDRRFDGLDHGKVAEKVMEAAQYGRKFDWQDPELKIGGQPRPQNRRGSGWG